MPFYESIFIVRQDVSTAQVETLTTGFADILQAQGGKVTKTEQWGLRTLAYRIKKNKKGHYVMFNLDAPVAAVAEMERNMGLHEDILRHMTIRVEELDTEPSAILRKEERTERGFGDRPSFGDAGDRPRRPRFEKSDSEGAL